MAIENKWSRQCLLPSKDPTADEVEIAWCGLLVFLCGFLWGRFFSLFLEHIKRKNKYMVSTGLRLSPPSLTQLTIASWANKTLFTAPMTSQEATLGRIRRSPDPDHTTVVCWALLLPQGVPRKRKPCRVLSRAFPETGKHFERVSNVKWVLWKAFSSSSALPWCCPHVCFQQAWLNAVLLRCLFNQCAGSFRTRAVNRGQ